MVREGSQRECLQLRMEPSLTMVGEADEFTWATLRSEFAVDILGGWRWGKVVDFKLSDGRCLG